MSYPGAFERKWTKAIGDPANWENVIKPNADGSINVNVTIVSPVTAGVADASTTTTGSDQTVLAANPARKGFLIEPAVAVALNANGNSAFVNLGATASAAAGSFEVLPGGYFPPAGMPLYLGAIHLFGVAGIAVTIKEYS